MIDCKTIGTHYIAPEYTLHIAPEYMCVLHDPYRWQFMHFILFSIQAID